MKVNCNCGITARKVDDNGAGGVRTQFKLIFNSQQKATVINSQNFK